jgi:RHS repeat-associated protein
LLNGHITKRWVYQDQLTLVAELDSAGNISVLFGPGYIVKNDTTYKLITDHLGSVRMVINASTGTITQRMEYDEFGNITSDSGSFDLPFGFAGGLYDKQTKLTRFGARDYDAGVGRWTSKDPILFAGGQSNLYGYVANDPVNFFDPNGNHFIITHAFRTFDEAFKIGYSFTDAIKLAYYASIGADTYGKSSSEKASITNRHAMLGRMNKSNTYQSPAEGKKEIEKFIKSELKAASICSKKGDNEKYLEHFGYALHDMQDQGAILHRGREWHQEDSWKHLLFEAVPAIMCFPIYDLYVTLSNL